MIYIKVGKREKIGHVDDVIENNKPRNWVVLTNCACIYPKHIGIDLYIKETKCVYMCDCYIIG